MGRQPEEYGACNRQIRHLRGELPLIAWHQMAVRLGERVCVDSITRIRCRVYQIRSPLLDHRCEYLAGLIEIVALRRIGRSLQRREKEFVHYHERLFGKQEKVAITDEYKQNNKPYKPTSHRDADQKLRALPLILGRLDRTFTLQLGNVGQSIMRPELALAACPPRRLGDDLSHH
jgi:hypothetical protein